MNNFFSKISLYDLLTTVVVGFILCIAVKNSQCCVSKALTEQFAPIATTLPYKIIIAFIVGLVFHKVTECFTHRNRTCFDNENTFFLIPLTMVSRSNLSLIKKIKTEMDKELNLKEKGEKDRTCDSDEKWLHDYYEAYYYLWKNNKLGVITTIEAHSAFIRDLFFALLIGIFLNLSNIKCCTIFLSLMILFIFFPIARYQCEKKIARLVWEGYYYKSAETSK